MRYGSANPRTSAFCVETSRPRPRTAVLVAHGDTDLRSAPYLRERLDRAIDEGAETIVVDLSESDLIDPASLGVLICGMRRLRAVDGRIRVVVARSDVRRVFELTMLDRVFSLYDTRDEAVAGDVR